MSQFSRFLRFWSPFHDPMTVRASLIRFGILFILFFLISLLPFIKAVEAQEIMPLNQATRSYKASEFPLSDLRSGMGCYALTTLKGQQPEKIELKIVGDTMNPFFHGKRLVLAEMQNGIPVAAGMSGSPVWCGKKLLGSLSSEYGTFPLKKGLAGITPIGYMRDQKGELGKKSVTSTQVIGQLRPIRIPLFATGAVFTDVSWLNHEMPSENFMFMLGGSEKQESASQHLGTISPGDSITMFLSRGAVEISATCTVTEVLEKTFSACGHPFLGEGEIELPVFRSSIVTTFQSAAHSFKIVGKTLEPVGTIVYDNAFAVEGARELRPDIMIPVNFSVTVDSDRYDYQFEVFKHNFYTSTLIEAGTRLLLRNLWADTRVGTSKLAAKIFLKNRAEPLEIYDADLISKQRTQVGFMEGYTDPWQILKKFQQTLNIIQQSEWSLVIERVELALNIWSNNRTLMLDSLAVLGADGKPTEEFHAGDILTVIVGMLSEDSTQKFVRKFAIEIPRNLNLVKPVNESSTFLPATIYIMSGTRYQEMDPKKLPKSQPDSAEEFLRILRLNQRDPSEIYAVLLLPPEYLAIQEVADFPELKPEVWNSVSNLEFLREHKTASESRVFSFSLGSPSKNALVSFVAVRPLKLMLK